MIVSRNAEANARSYPPPAIDTGAGFNNGMILHLNFAPGKRSKINAAQLEQNLDFCTAAVASGIDVWTSSHAKQIPSNFDPHSTIFNVRRVAKGGLYLVCDPLDVLKAFENGIENVVSFSHGRDHGTPVGNVGEPNG